MTSHFNWFWGGCRSSTTLGNHYVEKFLMTSELIVYRVDIMCRHNSEDREFHSPKHLNKIFWRIWAAKAGLSSKNSWQSHSMFENWIFRPRQPNFLSRGHPCSKIEVWIVLWYVFLDYFSIYHFFHATFESQEFCASYSGHQGFLEEKWCQLSWAQNFKRLTHSMI